MALMIHPYQVAYIDFTLIRDVMIHVEAAELHASKTLLVVPPYGKKKTAEQNAKVVWACGRELVSAWRDDLNGWIIQRKGRM